MEKEELLYPYFSNLHKLNDGVLLMDKTESSSVQVRPGTEWRSEMNSLH